MLDILSTGSFQNIGLLIWAQQGSEHVKPFGSNRVKIKRAQLKINLHSLIVHWMLVRNGKRTVTIQCILTELLQCKLHAKCLCLLMSALFWNFGLQWLCQEASDHHGSLTIFRSAFNALSVCVSWFLIERIQFLPNLNHMVSHGPNPFSLRLNGLHYKSYQELARPTLTFSLQM